MVANTAPIFSKVPRANWAPAAVTAANTAKDGTGTVATVFTAGADGSFVQKIVIRPRGTNIATVMRVFLNNGLTNATPANNSLIAEIGLAASTLSETAALIGNELPLNFPIPAGYQLNVTLGTAVAAGFSVSALGGGDY
jgi:hypothetical protein